MRQDALASNTIMSSTLLVCSQLAKVLFDLGATHLFISSSFVVGLNKYSVSLLEILYVYTPMRKCLITT